MSLGQHFSKLNEFNKYVDLKIQMHHNIIFFCGNCDLWRIKYNMYVLNLTNYYKIMKNM